MTITVVSGAPASGSVGSAVEPALVRLSDRGILPDLGQDHGAAIRALIAELGNATVYPRGAIIQAQAGSYNYTGNFTLPTRVGLFGRGGDRTRFINTDANNNTGYAITTTKTSGVFANQVKGFRLEATGTTILRSPVKPTCRDGLFVDRGMTVEDVQIASFRYGYAYSGDHEYLSDVQSGGCWAGEARLPGVSNGDAYRKNVRLDGNFWTSVYVDKDTYASGTWERTHFGLSPFAFYKEDGGTTIQVLIGGQFDSCGFENVGNAVLGSSTGVGTAQDLTFKDSASSQGQRTSFTSTDMPDNGSIYLGAISNFTVIGTVVPFPVMDTCVADVTSTLNCDFGNYEFQFKNELPTQGKQFFGTRVTRVKETYALGLENIQIKFMLAMSTVAQYDVVALQTDEPADGARCRQYDSVNWKVAGVAQEAAAVSGRAIGVCVRGSTSVNVVPGGAGVAVPADRFVRAKYVSGSVAGDKGKCIACPTGTNPDDHTLGSPIFGWTHRSDDGTIAPSVTVLGDSGP